MLYFAKCSADYGLTEAEIRDGFFSALAKLGARRKVIAVPPDFTRFHSQAGQLTRLAFQYYGKNLQAILPALGTHFPMTEAEIEAMFGDLPRHLFRIHHWKEDLFTLGVVPGEFVFEVSEGKLDYEWPAQVNKLLVEGGFDLILSIGQVVPHEVIGMANYNKNIFVGTGGHESINKSHFLGAVYGIERIMGRADTPVRRVLNYASDNFARQMPIVYVLTVIGKNSTGQMAIKGLFIGDDYECFQLASELSLTINFDLLDKPLKKVVVYLDPQEFKSTWLGNKSIYRTRMAIADGGELIVLAPGLREFGEDPEIDRLIRKYGYRTTPEVMQFVKENSDLQNNLSAAAHLIHGSSENRFTVIYCPGYISREEIESVNFRYGELAPMLARYDPAKMQDGFNILPDGEEVFYISNPALGLWATKERFNN
ncbi:MAG TPA: lactate racemase domain-containing protein [Candidatus Marinimicrobia bacterium]|nr:lactate racemase domain-containing protein [Candidatus Neomarinimicrobiota bacterium]HQE95376.1 lactate racemase domain-containing protein [Candidatus Neomarinimicrobiota bacterium]HQH56516.1 lactate racemase domain-containing protein [Candidatus Neomarinimicrobiota bacterium]HQK11813.1 lactate racemase domain-containing protein [Candidatus Neomarinimicrobiota bacterium]